MASRLLSCFAAAVMAALASACALAQNPDDLPQVFTIIEALQGPNIERTRQRMQKSASGRRCGG